MINTTIKTATIHNIYILSTFDILWQVLPQLGLGIKPNPDNYLIYFDEIFESSIVCIFMYARYSLWPSFHQG